MILSVRGLERLVSDHMIQLIGQSTVPIIKGDEEKASCCPLFLTQCSLFGLYGAEQTGSSEEGPAQGQGGAFIGNRSVGVARVIMRFCIDLPRFFDDIE